MGRSFADSQAKQTNGRNNQTRPKSEKCRADASAKSSKPPSANLLQKNLDDYLLNLSNFELKKKLESCPGNIVECPVLHDFREGLKKSISNHASITSRTESRPCKTSRGIPLVKDRNENELSEMSKQKSNESGDHKPSAKEGKVTGSTTSKGVIRSTRAQDLRSQSNRDLLKPKTTGGKTRSPTSLYSGTMPLKKKKTPSSAKSSPKSNHSKVEENKPRTNSPKNSKVPPPDKTNKERPPARNEISLQRQKTQEIINPKIVKKTGSSQSTVESAAGDCEPPQLKKSQTFFICKGAKNGEGDDKSKAEDGSPLNDPLSDGNATDDDLNPPHKPKPLTHNDSFCLIVKSSQNWSQKNRSDDEKWLQYGLTYEEKTKKSTDKGILKNSNYDLKSVDSLEKVESEKIVRFSDELLKNKKVLKKLVRRKKRFQNLLSPNWYKKNKLFQKYLQILREKSVLLSDRNDTPEHLKPFRVPIQVKERYEAEMFGLFPRKPKYSKNQGKDSYSY